jgi:hypothetical protein
MGKTLRRDVDGRRIGRGATPQRLIVAAALALSVLAALPARAQEGAPLRLDAGRFTVVHYAKDAGLARSLLASAQERDTFPGLPRPRQRVLIAVAPDRGVFREWVGSSAPEWGAAIAFPESRRIVVHGRDAGGKMGDPFIVLRHELAHLALHEGIGDIPPRWFDEGYASYAAGEWGRDEALATSVALVFRRLPTLDSLDAFFEGGSERASEGYALAHRAVAELAALDEKRGLSLFFDYWRQSRSIDAAVRQAYGVTLEDFERRWQERTRRRYGGIALTADFALLGLIGGATLFPLWLARRRRDRRRLAVLREADIAAEREARESVLAMLLSETGVSTDTIDESDPPTDPNRRDGRSGESGR